MLSMVASYILGSFLPSSLRLFGLGIFGTLFTILLTYISLKIDKKKFRDIGLEWEGMSIPKFLAGLSLGFIVYALIIAAIVLFTSQTVALVESPNLWSAIIISSFALLPQALMEEIAFRGYPLKLIQESYGVRFSIYMGALAFAMYHFIPGGNLIGSLLGTGVWGLVYGFLAIRSGGIAVPLGLHFSLNISQAIVGMKEPYTAIWQLVDRGSDHFYFDYDMDFIGLLAQIVILITTVILIEMHIRKKRLDN